jgi:hypothetical protein
MIELESKRSRFSIGGTFVDNGCPFYLILPRASAPRRTHTVASLGRAWARK